MFMIVCLYKALELPIFIMFTCAELLQSAISLFIDLVCRFFLSFFPPFFRFFDFYFDYYDFVFLCLRRSGLFTATMNASTIHKIRLCYDPRSSTVVPTSRRVYAAQ
ncbi:hypothetical protein BJX64DRAFT_246076 [Aspergillus heterothallicus]